MPVSSTLPNAALIMIEPMLNAHHTSGVVPSAHVGICSDVSRSSCDADKPPCWLSTALLMDFLNTTEKKERRLVHVPMGRFGEANEMAKAVIFLASPESSFVTGLDMKVDGGLTSAYVVRVALTSSR